MTDAPRTYIAVQEIWSQCSCDYNAVRSTRTLVLSPAMTIGEVMDWSRAIGNQLGVGDLKIVTEDKR